MVSDGVPLFCFCQKLCLLAVAFIVYISRFNFSLRTKNQEKHSQSRRGGKRSTKKKQRRSHTTHHYTHARDSQRHREQKRQARNLALRSLFLEHAGLCVAKQAFVVAVGPSSSNASPPTQQSAARTTACAARLAAQNKSNK